VVYAFNWYDVGAVLPLIGDRLQAGPVALGTVLAAFLVGVGLFQLPAGIAAVRFGSRPTCLAGLLVMGAAAAASGFAPTWPVLAGIRFVAGIGAAFFFAPGLSLIASYYPAGQRGPIIGLYNGGFSIGGAAGLVLGAFLGTTYGWGPALSLGGAVLLVMAGLCVWSLPELHDGLPTPTTAETLATTRKVLSSRSIWALSLALTGFWAAIYDVAQYFVQFARTVHPSWGYSTAALLAGIVVVISFPTGPVGGWLAERGWDRRVLIALFGIAASFGALAIPFGSLWDIGPILVALGAVDGIVFAILYLIPTYLEETGSRGLALGVGFVNSVQVLLGSGLAVLFAVVVGAYGFTDAWLFAGLASLALLPALAFVTPNRGGPRAGVAIAELHGTSNSGTPT
jgi:predicted MFS family arabinose efflux permease